MIVFVCTENHCMLLIDTKLAFVTKNKNYPSLVAHAKMSLLMLKAIGMKNT